jgi:hypothetical protein
MWPESAELLQHGLICAVDAAVQPAGAGEAEVESEQPGVVGQDLVRTRTLALFRLLHSRHLLPFSPPSAARPAARRSDRYRLDVRFSAIVYRRLGVWVHRFTSDEGNELLVCEQLRRKAADIFAGKGPLPVPDLGSFLACFLAAPGRPPPLLAAGCRCSGLPSTLMGLAPCCLLYGMQYSELYS